MSRAFVKEDVEVPERSHRVRSASGLPPGALNYMTAYGARRIRAQLKKLRSIGGDSVEIAMLEQVLASATIVELPEVWPESVAFGATVTVRDDDGNLETYRIVGADELGFETNAVSWMSPTGKALLGAELNDRVSLSGDARRAVKIVKIEYGNPAS